MNFDDFHQDGEQIFKLKRFEKVEGTFRETFSTLSYRCSNYSSEFPELSKIHPNGRRGRKGITSAMRRRTSKPNLMVSPSFLRMFDFELIEGE